MTNAPNAFPLLIGVTGKRTFASDPKTNDAIRERVHGRLAAAFAHINHRLPHAPKVLLTGGAYGTDLIAAKAALAAGNEWSVAMILPYSSELFEYDFILNSNQPVEWHPDLQTFHEMLSEATLGSGRRVIVREMPRLLTAAGNHASNDDLNKCIKPHDPALRHQHYEQVGQFIAETAMLLISVMSPDDQPGLKEANGGTARVVAVRRAGRPDTLGTDVASRSEVVRNTWNDLLSPPGGHDWLIDPYDAADRTAPPVSVLPPLLDRSVDEVYIGHPGLDLPETRERHAKLLRLVLRAQQCTARSCARLRQFLTGQAPAPPRVRESLHLLRSFDDFERLSLLDPNAALASTSGAGPLDDEPDQPGHILHLRDRLRWPQGHSRQKVDTALGRVATLFVVAIVALEIYGKFYHESPIPLFIYVLTLIAIATTVFATRLHFWQPRSEDYRAVMEMLRVQHVWWAAGLNERVDRVHLQGADAELSRPRDAARAILGWVTLRAYWATETGQPPRWQVVRTVRAGERPDKARPTKALVEAKGAELPTDWIGAQVRYYGTNYERREEMVWRRETQTWLMFTTSGALAALVVLWLGDDCMGTDTQAWFAHLADHPAYGWAHHLAFLPWAVLTILVAALRWDLREVRGVPSVILTLVAGGICAFGLAVALHALGALLFFVVHDLMPVNQLSYINTEFDMTKRLVVVVLVALTAGAGAVHFHAEKRGFEAEAFAYRDALDKFERAEQTFADLVDPASGVPTGANIMAARHLVRELGLLALRENETWLKTHRERPLSPVVG